MSTFGSICLNIEIIIGISCESMGLDDNARKKERETKITDQNVFFVRIKITYQKRI